MHLPLGVDEALAVGEVGHGVRAIDDSGIDALFVACYRWVICEVA